MCRVLIFHNFCQSCRSLLPYQSAYHKYMCLHSVMFNLPSWNNGLEIGRNITSHENIRIIDHVTLKALHTNVFPHSKRMYTVRQRKY